MCAAKRPRDGDDASTPVAIFLFRRDFRLHDNTALNQLIHHINNTNNKNNTNIQIIPIFIFNPRQCDATRNPYFSDASFGFLCESLVDLDGGGGGNENDADVGAGLNGTLVCMEAQDDATCLAHVLEAGYRIVAIATNADVTPFAKERDAKLHDWCATHDVVLILGAHDYQLLPPDVVRNTSGGSYRIFTPYYHCVLAKHAANIPREASIPSSSSSLRTSLWCVDARQRLSRHLVNPATRPLRRLAQPRFHGGRCRGLALLHRVVGGEMANYAFDRNALAEERTSFLSPYLKYGCISVREVWWAAVSAYGLAHEYTRQLVWREFFTMLICQHPQLLQGQLNEAPTTTTTSSSSLRNATLLAKYNNFEWSWDDEHFAAFRRGETGVPLVDASVRCLTQTGWCSNRCRMIVAHMLVKVLGVDWRDGERWYASVALDYDPCNNSGGWQWSSGQGCEAQFRHHNFYRQSSMFDPLAIFIHRWIPELREVPPKMIHAWDVVSVAPRPPSTQKISYPAPMVDVRAMSEKMMIKYKQHTTNNNNNTNNIRQ